MQCTKEQIEEKRRLALQKLANSKHNLSNRGSSNIYNSSPGNQTGLSSNNSPSPVKSQFKFKSTGLSPLHSSKPYEKPKEILNFIGKDKTTIKFSLVSETRFQAEITTFNTQVIDVFKTIPSKNYDPKTRTWDFGIKDYTLLIGKLQALVPAVFTEKLPNYVLNCLNKEKRDYSSIDLSPLDPELSAALMPFQQEGVRYGIDKNGRCLIADDMGLGKTFQALGIADYYRKDWPLLVVTTASMKNVWEETIHKYLPGVPSIQVQYMMSGKDYIGECKILIVSHDMMSRCLDKLKEKNFGVVIIDESHNLKNFKAKCTKSATELAKRCKRLVLLSGTPALSRPSELYTQLSLIDDRFFGSFFDYSKRYCDGKTTNFGWDASGKSNLQELEILLNRRFMIRRTKQDVLKALPNKVQEVITLDVNLNQFSEEDKRCLNALAAKYRSEKKGNQKHAALLTFFSETAKIKIPSICSYILQILHTKQKFLIFAHHQRVLDAVANILQRKSIKFIRIDGNTTSEQRKYFVDRFQLDDDYLVAVLSITAANAGLTLTAAQLVIFAELHWNPSILSQAESRAHRIGQVKPVIVKYLLAPGTADDSIWPMIQEKQKILSEVGLSKDNFSNVEVKKQETDKVECLTEDLNITRTASNTLDISTYFKGATADASTASSTNNVSGEGNNDSCVVTDCDVTSDDFNDVFDDGLDDVFSSIDF